MQTRKGPSDWDDADGELMEGMEPWANEEAVDQVFYFTGWLFDKATGLQCNDNRWCNSEIGRWMSEDPIGLAAGDANLCRYVGNMPTMYIDPSGTDITIETGNDADGTCRSANNTLHQQVCVDTWYPNGQNKGKKCYSFGSIGDTGPLSGIWSTGEVYDPDPVPGEYVDHRKKTTHDQDATANPCRTPTRVLFLNWEYKNGRGS